MKAITQTITYHSCDYDELSDADKALIEAAKQQTLDAYAPYSHFHVGAAVALADGTIVTGNNQENAAYPSGLCAERCAMFHANATYPTTVPLTLAIAASDWRKCYSGPNGTISLENIPFEYFTEVPVTPCGACRQVLIETERRYHRPLRVLLYGAKCVYIIDRASDLLPLQFEL